MNASCELTKDQKQAVGLLSIGTILEYFDLMLYVYMAVILNDLFFSQTDPHTASLFSAFAFCSTYVLRPFGALIFGWIGDNIGRKSTVIITTLLMAFSSVCMANLPTYQQIGVSAAWIVTICRILQGMSSMGEIIGAELYLAEFIKPPARYYTVALIGVCGTVGMTLALLVASIFTSFGFNWRIAFWCGAAVALVGTVARSTLRETPDFVDAKKQMQDILTETGIAKNKLKNNIIYKQKASKKTTIAYFLIECAWPVWFYLGYIHCGNILKTSFNYTGEQIIHHNLMVSIVDLIGSIALTYLTSMIHPLKILKVKLIIFTVFALISPILLSGIGNPFQLMLFQFFIAIFAPTGFPAVAVFFMSFPVFKRFTYASFTYALSRALMYSITSFGLVYLIKYFNHWGLLIIIVPILCGYAFGRNHFETLERELGNYS